MVVHLIWPFWGIAFCNSLRITLMFFNSVQSYEVKKCKIDKHMELGLYRQPIINFKRPKSKGKSRGMYLKILSCDKCWKNSTSATASSPMPSIFQVNLVFLPTFFLPRNSFQLSQLSTDLFNSNNRLSVLFRPLESSVKDKNFQSTSVFYQVVFKNFVRVLHYNGYS